MTRHLALVVDDEPDIRELLELTLGRMEIDTFAAENLTQARALLAQHPFDLCLTDMRLPDGSGMELVEHIQKNHASLPVAVITAHGSMEMAISALKAGAFDFVSKPVDLHVLRTLVTAALKLSEQSTQPGGYTGVRERRSRHILLGDSAPMQAIRATIAKLARSQAPVYISGESGTGKELIAHLIHDKGPRADGLFVPVNCGAIPEHLMESEFFGHKKGSFTGAGSDKDGLFQAAHGGTLFLDEVADLPLHMQVKLLRAIQEKAVRPVGAQKETPIDVRILCATHKNLAALVKEGAFREDLYYRLNVIELHAPSLRERREDIPLLAEHILNRLVPPGTAIPALSKDAHQALSSYSFPGNVRELENILERAITLCEGNTIQVADLHLPRTREPEIPAPTASATPAADAPLSLEPYLDTIEKDTIMKALEQARYNKTAAAKLLGITFRALRYRLKKLGVE
ncbi:MAG: sigma-54-dependent Fis family transcriptional regulator [Gammaproteobacteria bacterium]|nr:sigma-54-dependent Fis family transcriptional regulator [Gammaproteobacteria bacterium]